MPKRINNESDYWFQKFKSVQNEFCVLTEDLKSKFFPRLSSTISMLKPVQKVTGRF